MNLYWGTEDILLPGNWWTPILTHRLLLKSALNKCRVRIETTFGVIKFHFNCLRCLRVSPERACQIISACVVLHNVAVIRKERPPHVPVVAPDIMDPITLDHPTNTAIKQATTEHFSCCQNNKPITECYFAYFTAFSGKREKSWVYNVNHALSKLFQVLFTAIPSSHTPVARADVIKLKVSLIEGSHIVCSNLYK